MNTENNQVECSELIKSFVSTFLSGSGDGLALNVPDEMKIGNTDEDGWSEWKAIDSPVTKQEIEAIESLLGFKLPSLLVEYLTYKSLLMTDFIVRLPQTPYSKPLSEFMEYISLYKNRFETLGLFPFAYDENDAGPICLDMKSSTKEWPVVIYDYTKATNGSYRGDQAWSSLTELFQSIVNELKQYQ